MSNWHSWSETQLGLAWSSLDSEMLESVVLLTAFLKHVVEDVLLESHPLRSIKGVLEGERGALLVSWASTCYA